VLVAAGTVTASRLSADRSPPAVAPSPSPVAPVWKWTMAQLARDGHTITVFLEAPGDCRSLTDLTVTTASDAGAVTLDVRARPGGGIECERSRVLTPLRADLGEPLGDRVLRSTYDGGERPVYRDRDLPATPPGYGSPNDEGAWATSLRRADGAELTIQAAPTAAVAETERIGTIEVGPFHATLHRGGAITGYEARWTVGGLTYRLTALPAEGGSIGLDRFRELVASLRWSQ